MRGGRSVSQAISAGYKKGLTAILDANIVTVLVAFILFVLAIGGNPIKGPGADRGFVFQADSLLPWRRVLGNAGIGLWFERQQAAEPGRVHQLGGQHRLADLAQRRQQRLALGAGGEQGQDVLLHVSGPLEHGLVLAGEVAEEGAGRHVGRGGDVVDRGLVVAAGLEQRERRLGDGAAGAGGLPPQLPALGRRAAHPQSGAQQPKRPRRGQRI